MKTIKLKNPNFKCIQYTDCTDEAHIQNLRDIKHFCGEDVKITLETCEIDDFWCVTLYDYIKEKDVVVPGGSYIIELPDGGFTYISEYDYDRYFENAEN